MTNQVLAIVGPTATGKTDLSIRLACHFETEILSADSRQIYKEMSIGTAKPEPQQLAQVSHYFIGSHSIQEPLNAGIYEQLALKQLGILFAKKPIAVVVGGSGLYLQAVCQGFDDVPASIADLREQLMQELDQKGIDFLLNELSLKDPTYYSEVDKDNPHRVIRALEVIRSSGETYSSFRQNTKKARDFKVTKLGILMDREVLYQRINLRVERMMEQGLLKEVESLVPHKKLPALQTVGYKELFQYLDGELSLEKAVDQIKQNTRRYAKRQLTWFRADPSIVWVKSAEEALSLLRIKVL